MAENLEKLINENVIKCKQFSSELDICKLQDALYEIEQNKCKIIENKCDLEKTPTSLFNDTELKILNKYKDEIINGTKNMENEINIINERIKVLDEFNNKKDDIIKMLKCIDKDFMLISKACEIPQSLISVENCAKELRLQLDKIEEQSNTVKFLLSKPSFNYEIMTTEFNLLNNNINCEKEKISNLLIILEENIEFSTCFERKKRKIIDEFEILSNREKNICILDVNEKAEQMTKLENDIQLLLNEVQSINQDADNMNKFTLIDTNRKLDFLEQSLIDLLNLLIEKRNSAAKKLSNATILSKITSEFEHIQNNMQKVEYIDSDENATKNDLEKAKEVLKELEQHFNNIQENINTLCMDDENTTDIRNETNYKLSELGLQTKTLLQSLTDRINELQNFNDKMKIIDNDMNEINEQISDISKNYNSVNIFEIEKLTNCLQTILLQLSTVNESIRNLAPLIEPRNQVENFLQRHNKLQYDLEKIKERIKENEEKYETDVHKYIEELDNMESTITNNEQKVNNIINEDDINKFINDEIFQCNEQLKIISSKISPNDELNKRLQQIKDRLNQLTQNIYLKQKQITTDNANIEHLRSEISKNEFAIEAICQRYNEPQELNIVEKDIDSLKTLIESLVNIPLDKVSDKLMYDDLQKYIETILVKSNVCYFLIYL